MGRFVNHAVRQADRPALPATTTRPPVTGQRSQPGQPCAFWPPRSWAGSKPPPSPPRAPPTPTPPTPALGTTDPIGSGLAWLQSQILSDGQLSRTSALVAPTQARCETAKTLLR